MQIVNKIVLITGASSGIGAAIAKAACQAGADRILLMARSERRLGKVADEIKSKGGKAIVYPVDLTNPGEVQTVTQHILDPVGAPDILINNAGIGRWNSCVKWVPRRSPTLWHCSTLPPLGSRGHSFPQC